ncbi:hypothetical protein [Sphingomonas sp. Leaf230]|uniref:hypothetical protein n=1 Tax=Sphingomonas sp. Leaf230 TaxID=1735694 RepID=UPI000B19F5E3|nr:hypothetical protein [Sphingomonas sp. Leaf230]
MTKTALVIGITRQVGNLGAKRDYSRPREYVLGERLMVRQDEANDYVLATEVATPAP